MPLGRGLPGGSGASAVATAVMSDPATGEPALSPTSLGAARVLPERHEANLLRLLYKPAL